MSGHLPEMIDARRARAAAEANLPPSLERRKVEALELIASALAGPLRARLQRALMVATAQWEAADAAHDDPQMERSQAMLLALTPDPEPAR